MKTIFLCLSIFIVDGDTLHCRTESENIKVRLAALDCPELRDPGGYRAKRALQSLLAGRTVHLEPRGRDRYGRTVARVLAGPLDAACELIKAGVCRRYDRYDRKGEYVKCER